MSTTDVKPLPVKLQINTTGARRHVIDFDCADSGRVLPAAAELFSLIVCTGRVIMSGDTEPLMLWTPERGWVEWAQR